MDRPGLWVVPCAIRNELSGAHAGGRERRPAPRWHEPHQLAPLQYARPSRRIPNPPRAPRLRRRASPRRRPNTGTGRAGRPSATDWPETHGLLAPLRAEHADSLGGGRRAARRRPCRDDEHVGGRAAPEPGEQRHRRGAGRWVSDWWRSSPRIPIDRCASRGWLTSGSRVIGVGKTTTFGKVTLPRRIGVRSCWRPVTPSGHHQLALWAEPAGTEILRGAEAVVASAKAATTWCWPTPAGRLRAKVDLSELRKIRRVADHESRGRVTEVLLVLDGRTSALARTGAVGGRGGADQARRDGQGGRRHRHQAAARLPVNMRPGRHDTRSTRSPSSTRWWASEAPTLLREGGPAGRTAVPAQALGFLAEQESSSGSRPL